MEGIIKKLPQNAQRTLQASCHINSLKKTVEELLYNSLDSNSTSIAIRVNCNDLSIQTIDNGRGIRPSDMDIIGTRYATSKAISERTSDYYGYKGMALSSIINISGNLKITSRFLGCHSTWVKEYRKGKCEVICETIERPSNGTTVEIKGLLYNLAIPRKDFNAKAELQEVKNLIEHTAVCHPGVSFSLRDDNTNNVIVKIPKNKDVVQAIQSIYGIKIENNCKELQIEKNKYKIKAFIGNRLIEDDCQLIYLNKRSVINSKLHKLFNDDLMKIFGVGNEGRNKQMTMTDLSRAESNKKMYPFFVLFISCPYTDYGLSQVSNKTLVEFYNWTPITAILRRLCKVFEESLQSTNKTEKKKEIEPNIPTDKTNKDLIQEKVANIVNKILKSNPKQLQVQNEVKGKPAKRKLKKPASKGFKLDINLLSSKSAVKLNKLQVESVKQKRQCEDPSRKQVVNPIDANESELKSIKKQTPAKVCTETHIKHIQFKKSEITNESHFEHRKVNAKPTRQLNNKQVCLPQKAVSKVFEAVDGSVKQRCKNLSTNVSKLMKKYNLKQQNTKCFKIEQVTTSKRVYKNKTQSIQKRSGQIVIKQFVPFPKNCDKKTFLKKYFNAMLKDELDDKLEVKSRYDLLQPITSENEHNESKNAGTMKINEKNNVHKNTLLKCILPNETKRGADKYIPSGTCEYLNYLTYQSHNYKKDFQVNKLMNKKNQYVTKTKAISRYIQTDCPVQNSIAFKKPTSFQLTKPNEYENLSPDTKNQAVQYNNTAEPETEYNFDDEVNKPIELTLTQHEMSETYCNVEDCFKNFKNSHKILPDCSNNKNTTYTIEKDLPQMKENIIIADTIVIDSNENSNISVDYISDTFDGMNININDDMIFESIHENVITESNNEKYNDLNLLKNNEFKFSDVINKDIQVTFASKPLPEDEENVEHEISESGPIEMCEVVMESSDLFNSDFLNFKTPFSQKINYLENNAQNTDNSETNYEIGCKISENETDTELPYVQMNHSCLNFDSELKCTQPLKEISLNNNNLEVNNSPNLAENSCKINRNYCNINVNGKPCFLDLKTGMTRAKNELLEEEIYSTKKRPNYVPKGLSPIFKHEKIFNKETMVMPSQECFTKSMYENFTDDVERGTRIYEAGVKNLADNSDGNGVRYKKLDAAVVFDNAAIAKAQVIRQIDNKFIACLIEGHSYKDEGMAQYLVLFDQHAVDERIRLEQLMQEYKIGPAWKSEPYNMKLVVSEEERFYVVTYPEKFSEIGFQWSLDSAEGKFVMNITAIPQAIVGKHGRKIEAIISAVKSVIREHVKTVKCMKGAASAPKSMLDLLNMEACRSAVKFGDELTRERCVLLVRAVAECAAPFQCAHGRPDMAVLLLIPPQQRGYQIDIKKLEEMKLKFNW